MSCRTNREPSHSKKAIRYVKEKLFALVKRPDDGEAEPLTIEPADFRKLIDVAPLKSSRAMTKSRG